MSHVLEMLWDRVSDTACPLAPEQFTGPADAHGVSRECWQRQALPISRNFAASALSALAIAASEGPRSKQTAIGTNENAAPKGGDRRVWRWLRGHAAILAC